MYDPTEPLLFFVDANSPDLEGEVKALFECQRMLDRLLRQEVEPAEFMEFLEAQPVDSQNWHDRAIANIERAIERQLPFDGTWLLT